MTEYIYDPMGNRVAKGAISTFSCNSVTNGFTFTNLYVDDLQGRQLLETSGWNYMLHANFFLNGQLLATNDNGTNWYYNLNDWVGTKRVVANMDGSADVGYVSLPYGDGQQAIAPWGQDDTEHHFTGKERDIESGNDYFFARYYSSNQGGRFLTPDPSQLYFADPTNPQSLNLYAYVQNNPLSNTDPTGLDCVYINNDTGAYQGFNSGDCDNSTEAKANSGYYVDGTVNQISFNDQNQVIGYSGSTGDGIFDSFAGSTDMSAGPAAAFLNPYTNAVSLSGQSATVNGNGPQTIDTNSENIGNLANPAQFQNYKPGQRSIGPYTPPPIPKLTGNPACFGAPDSVSDIHNLERGIYQNSPQGATDGSSGASAIYQSTTQGNRPFGNAAAATGFNGAFLGFNYAESVANCLQGH